MFVLTGMLSLVQLAQAQAPGTLAPSPAARPVPMTTMPPPSIANSPGAPAAMPPVSPPMPLSHPATLSGEGAPLTGGFGADGTDFELDMEVLVWWTRTTPIPALFTGSAPQDLGILGRPSTVVTLGDEFISFNGRAGGRFTNRTFIDEGWGVYSSIFWLQNGSHYSNLINNPVLAVPITDPSSGEPTSIRLAIPGASVGTAQLEMGQRLWGADVGVVCRVDDSFEWKVDFLGGFRFLQLHETLKMRTTSTLGTTGLFSGVVTPSGSYYTMLDDFNTRNSFYGGNLGTRILAEVLPNIVVVTTAQVGLGVTNAITGIDGASSLAVPDQPTVFAQGGNYAQRSNIGRYPDSRFAVVPQIGVTVGYQMGEHLRLSIGYDLLYWSSVQRPGDQIDRVVNPNYPPIQNDGSSTGPTRPVPILGYTDFWAQGLSASLSISF